MLHFSRRKFCGKTCFFADLEARPETGMGWMTTHRRARKLVPPGPCVRCGAPKAKDVHHRDGNHTNNLRENLERICRSCHIKEHRKVVPCSVCGKPQKGLGFCEKHYQRFKKWGDPRLTKRNQHLPLVASED